MINEALSLSCQGAQVSYSGLFSQVTQQRKRLLRLQERVDSFDRQLEFLHRQRVSDLVASGGKGTTHGPQADHPSCRLSIYLEWCFGLGDITAQFKSPLPRVARSLFVFLQGPLSERETSASLIK